jgi:hypothetical protein
MLRAVGEDAEDDFYTENRFAPLRIPLAAARRLRAMQRSAPAGR